MPRYVAVALPVPLHRPFTYALPDGLAHEPVVGSRVVVPFRNRKHIGIVVATDVTADRGRAYKNILQAPDPAPVVSPAMLRVCQWMSGYYAAPLGIVLRAALPAALSGAATPIPASKTRRVLSIARELPTLMERDRTFGRAKQQRALYELLESLGGRSAVEHLIEHLSFSSGVLTGLAEKGLVRVEDETVLRDPFATRAAIPATPHDPTAAQRHAIDALVAAKPGSVSLLHGITGSGKTLVYLELLRHLVVTRGKSAIVLVPEIALTPQTVDRFRAVFGDSVAVLHSALSDGERYDAWRALQRGEKRIAVGARSAIFAPLPALGAIVVDEEHESTYKQEEAPRYHARDVAIIRAREEGAIVVLGSATPSLESWVNAARGRYTLLTLPERVGGGRLPAVQVVDLRRGSASSGMPADPVRQVLSAPLETALRDRLERGEQSILLLNRRGYSAFVQCGDCGDVAVCPNCAVSLTYHRGPERLVCHYCQHHEESRTKCIRCNGETIRRRGMGTQQVERVLSEQLPSARIARMDIDTTSGKWAHAEILDRVGRGEVDVLLGTQMIAKGLDFPNVTLVGVIDADVGINFPDFRASERCFQLLSQVAGRAGRGPKGGEVFIQTRVPTHHAVRFAVAHDYHAFVREELEGRRDPPYPPNARLARIVFSGLDERLTAGLSEVGARWLKRLVAGKARDVTVIGPAPCPVEKVKSRWRWHVLLRAEQQAPLTRVLRYFSTRFDVPANTARLRTIIDRDPVSLL